MCVCFSMFLYLSACKDKPCASTIPEISFEDFIIYEDNTAQLFLNLYDCDGDIGLNENDTLAPFDLSSTYHYNLKLTYLEKQNGSWIRFDSLEPPFYYRIPRLNKTDNPNTTEGSIHVTLEPFYYVPIGSFDTIKYEIIVIDRALQSSTVIETPEIYKP